MSHISSIIFFWVYRTLVVFTSYHCFVSPCCLSVPDLVFRDIKLEIFVLSFRNFPPHCTNLHVKHFYFDMDYTTYLISTGHPRHPARPSSSESHKPLFNQVIKSDTTPTLSISLHVSWFPLNPSYDDVLWVVTKRVIWEWKDLTKLILQKNNYVIISITYG